MIARFILTCFLITFGSVASTDPVLEHDKPAPLTTLSSSEIVEPRQLWKLAVRKIREMNPSQLAELTTTQPRGPGCTLSSALSSIINGRKTDALNKIQELEKKLLNLFSEQPEFEQSIRKYVEAKEGLVDVTDFSVDRSVRQKQYVGIGTLISKASVNALKTVSSYLISGDRWIGIPIIGFAAMDGVFAHLNKRIDSKIKENLSLVASGEFYHKITFGEKHKEVCQSSVKFFIDMYEEFEKYIGSQKSMFKTNRNVTDIMSEIASNISYMKAISGVSSSLLQKIGKCSELAINFMPGVAALAFKAGTLTTAVVATTSIFISTIMNELRVMNHSLKMAQLVLLMEETYYTMFCLAEIMTDIASQPKNVV